MVRTLRCWSVPLGCLGPLQVVFEVDLVGFLALTSSEETVGDRGCPFGRGRAAAVGRLPELMERRTLASLRVGGADRRLAMGPEGSPKAQVEGGLGP